MRRQILLSFVIWLGAASSVSTSAAEAKILKVLPHLMDEQGRISVAPGLYERDSYQRQLRENPKRISGVRFDIQWKAKETPEDRLKLRVFIRAAKKDPWQTLKIEADVKGNRRLGGWSTVRLAGESFQNSGEILAWKVVLYDGEQVIAEQKSFLW